MSLLNTQLLGINLCIVTSTLWSQVLRLHWADDGPQAKHLLVSLLEVLRPSRHVLRLHLLHRLLQAGQAGQLRVPGVGGGPRTLLLLCLDDVGARLCYLLPLHSAGNFHAGLDLMTRATAFVCPCVTKVYDALIAPSPPANKWQKLTDPGWLTFPHLSCRT